MRCGQALLIWVEDPGWLLRAQELRVGRQGAGQDPVVLGLHVLRGGSPAKREKKLFLVYLIQNGGYHMYRTPNPGFQNWAQCCRFPLRTLSGIGKRGSFHAFFSLLPLLQVWVGVRPRGKFSTPH